MLATIIIQPYFIISLDVAHPEEPAKAICAIDDGNAYARDAPIPIRIVAKTGEMVPAAITIGINRL